MTHVAYEGAAPAMPNLMGGRITLMATSIGSSAAMIRGQDPRDRDHGRETGAKRARALPEISTAAEQGLSGFDVTTWHAMLGPVKVPPPIVAKLNREFVRTLGMPEVQEKLMSEGGEVSPTTPNEPAASVHSEVVKWGEVLRADLLR
jgi:tripartite-type tricarboxylate transporter receptor subunit TctC